MNTVQNRRQCAVCEESEPSFINTVTKSGNFRTLLADCLAKNHQKYYCPLCLIYFPNLPPPHDRKIWPNCQSISPLPPPPPLASCFTCPLCAASSDQSGIDADDGSGTPIGMKSAEALVTATDQLKIHAANKITEARGASLTAKDALMNPLDLDSRKRKLDDR